MKYCSYISFVNILYLIENLEQYMKIKLTIFTPTYNRGKLILRLYKSLLNQSCYDFEWLVVDDGSSDNTEQLFNSLLHENNPFEIVYKKKNNGGKCSAINIGVELARGDYFLIVDSDDYLTDNAVSLIIERFNSIEKNESFGAIAFLRCHPNMQCIGGDVNYQILDSDFLSYRRDLHYIGDRAEVIRTSVLRKYPFPVYENEKFLSESTIWNRIAKVYKCRYFNEKIYICEYQEGGLSDSSSRMFNNSPKGSMLYYKECFLDSKTFKQKLIFCSLYWRFSFSTNYKNHSELKPLASMYPFLLFYPFYLIIRYWFHKNNGRVAEALNKSKK